MFRCIADPDVLLINGTEPIEEKKMNLENFLDFLQSNKTIYSYDNYNKDLTKNLDISLNYIKKSKNKDEIELLTLLYDIEQLKENYLEMHQIITDFAVKNFDEFLKLLEKKFSNQFIDFILTNRNLNSKFKTLKSYERKIVGIFQSKNLIKSRSIGYIISSSKSSNKNQAQIKNFKDFENIVLDNLGFNDLSGCEIYIIQPDILNTLYSQNKRIYDKINLRIFLRVILNYFVDKFSNAARRPTIYFIADEKVLDPKNHNISILKEKFTQDFITNFSDDLEIKIETVQWSKKSERESRLFYSSNYHGFAFNRGFDFFIEGEYGNKDSDALIYADSEIRNQLRVEKRVSKFFENVNNDYINLIKQLFRSAKNTVQGKNLDNLKELKKRLLKNYN